MSDIDQRVGSVEREQARFGERLGHVETTVDRTARGVEQLLERDARRPEPTSLRAVAGTLLVSGAVIGMLAGFTWWAVASAPAVQKLDERLTELDHPRIGRVKVLERKIKKFSGWEARISKNNN